MFSGVWGDQSIILREPGSKDPGDLNICLKFLQIYKHLFSSMLCTSSPSTLLTMSKRGTLVYKTVNNLMC